MDYTVSLYSGASHPKTYLCLAYQRPFAHIEKRLKRK